MQERCNSIANALELHLSCTNPSIYFRTPNKLLHSCDTPVTWKWDCSAAAKRSPNVTNKTVGQPRFSQLQVRLTTQDFLQPKSMSDCVVIKIYIFFSIFLCWTAQNQCRPGWSAGRPRIFRQQLSTGPISQMVYELITEILWMWFSFLWFWFLWSYQVTILNM